MKNITFNPETRYSENTKIMNEELQELVDENSIERNDGIDLDLLILNSNMDEVRVDELLRIVKNITK